MKKISIKKLGILYNKISKNIKKTHKYKSRNRFNHLNLSVHLSRDLSEFDIANYKLFLELFSYKNLNIKRSKNKNCQEIYIYSFKESQYLPTVRLPILALIDSLKILKQLIDASGLFIIIIFSILKNKLNKRKKGSLRFFNKKIYSIYFWNKKGSSSSSYYYPDIDNDSSNLAYISSFADSKFLSAGLLNSLKYRNLLSPVNLITFKGLILSLIQFIHLYLNDCFLGIFHKDYYFLKFWFGWKKTAEIFYCILTYNSIKELVKNSSNCEFISWYENQITNRSFSLGASLGKRTYKSPCEISSFFGTPFSRRTKYQYLPLKYEFEIGFWGDKFYLQDKNSLTEMKGYLKKIRNNLPLEIVPESMLRIKTKDIKNELKNHSKRLITIFTHDTYWDLIACVLSIFNPRNKACKIPKKLLKKSKIINIRLHPSLDKNKALEELKNIKEIPQDIKFSFIDNKYETLIDSLLSSSYSFFGLSSHINIAINLKCNVFGVITNHIYKNPIKEDLLDSSKLEIVIPW